MCDANHRLLLSGVLAPAGTLSTIDAVLISGLAFKAAKRLATGAEVEAVVLLRTFNGEVSRLMTIGLPAVIGRSLIARAERVLHLMAHPM